MHSGSLLLEQSPWETSSLARGSASDEQVSAGSGRAGAGSVSSEQPSEVGGARGWISTVTCIGPCGGIGNASTLLRAVGGELSSVSVSEEEA